MSQYENKMDALQADRRNTARFVAKCDAIFRTVSGDRRGTMENVSELGARFATKRPPVQGVTGLLLVGSIEIFCKVAWANADACGLVFDHPISLDALAQISGELPHVNGPVARAGNIPLGRKRSGRLVSGEE